MIKHSLNQRHEAKLNELGDTLLMWSSTSISRCWPLAAAVDAAVPRPSHERRDRQPFSTDLMVRVLLAQQPFNLSDEQMEFQLLVHLSFQRFVRLCHNRTAIWTFKERLIQTDAKERIFDAVNHQLSMHG